MPQPLGLAARRQARDLLRADVAPEVVAITTRLEPEVVAAIATSLARDALCGTGDIHRRASAGLHPTQLAAAHQVVAQANAAAAHAARMARAKPTSEAEMRALIDQHLARRGASRCPAGTAIGAGSPSSRGPDV